MRRKEDSRVRNAVPKVYAYTTPGYAERKWSGRREGKGLLKIGYTERSVSQRVKEQFPIKLPDDRPYEIVYEEDAITNDEQVFNDSLVHSKLEEIGVFRVQGEWFECTLEELRAVVIKIKHGKKVSDIGRTKEFEMRPEQTNAVKAAMEYFQSFRGVRTGELESQKPHFMWNAKMRFGKTFATYMLAKQMEWKRVLILTYKPAVAGAWREDLLNHVEFDGWQFVDREGVTKDIIRKNPIVWFASFQDVLGRTSSGERKERLQELYNTKWDCVVLDEYHFGSWRDAAKDLYAAENEIGENEERGDEFSEMEFPLQVGHYLYLSGTPFRILASGEFSEGQIYSWTYSDEQRAKQSWSTEEQGPNPYLELPELSVLTYQIPDEIRMKIEGREEYGFDLNEFFKADEKVQSTEEGDDTIYVFKYESAVQDWLHLIRGKYLLEELRKVANENDWTSVFGDTNMGEHLRHTLWFLPSVASCKAMERLLRKKQNRYYSDYDIIVAAGQEAGVGEDAVNLVVKEIGNGINTKSITLTCGKLTTGVSIPQWSAILMLRNTSSAEAYFQAAFRVQTPWQVSNIDGVAPNKKTILKKKCYVLDFAPTRALDLIAKYCQRVEAGEEEKDIEDSVENFVKFLPVLCYDGFSMKVLDASELLDVAIAGTASTMLAKRWQSNRMINIGSDTLEKLLQNEEILQSLAKIEDYRNIKDDLKAIITHEESLQKMRRNKQKINSGIVQKNRKLREDLRRKLLKFVARIPVFMYLTDHREKTMKEVIANIEPKLFTKVTGLSVKEFEELCSIGVFESKLMNATIFAFKKIEDASLLYIGGNKLTEIVGGFDVVEARSGVSDSLNSKGR